MLNKEKIKWILEEEILPEFTPRNIIQDLTCMDVDFYKDLEFDDMDFAMLLYNCNQEFKSRLSASNTRGITTKSELIELIYQKESRKNRNENY